MTEIQFKKDMTRLFNILTKYENHLITEYIKHEPTSLLVRQTDEIRRAINKWDPRLHLVNVNATMDEDNSIFNVEIQGYVQGLREFSYSRVLVKE